MNFSSALNCYTVRYGTTGAQSQERETVYIFLPANIKRTKSHNLNVSCLVLQLSLHNPLKPGVKSRMEM